MTLDILNSNLCSKLVSDLYRDLNCECLMSNGFINIDEVVIDHVWVAMRFCTSAPIIECEDDIKLMDIDATVKDVVRIKSSRVSNKIGSAIS